MDEALIYRKTKRGAAELTATHGALSSPARRVLILLDGQRTLAELAELFGAESVEHLVAELETQGFVRQVDPDNALTTQALPTLVGELRLEPIAPPPSRRASAWIALTLLVAAAATAGGGYWFFLRPNQASEPVFAAAGTSDAGRPASDAPPASQVVADDRSAESPSARVMPLSGLPAVTVSQTKRVAAEAVTQVADVVPAPALAAPASALADPPAPGRRSSEKTTNDRTAGDRGTPAAPLLAAARAALETSQQSDTGSAASAAVQALSTRTPVALPTSAAPAPVSEPQAAPSASAAAPAPPAPAATSQSTPVATAFPVSATPTTPAPSAARAPLGEQVASLAPPPRPQSGPVELRQRKHTPPEFPVRAVRAKVFEGHVLARIWVNADGNVEQVDIVKANPPRLFDDEVKRALTAWTFDPPGRPVDTTVELDFKP